MTLTLVDGKVLIETMYVPELKEHTFVNLVLENNTNHLKPVIYINEIRFEHNVIHIKEDIKGNEVLIKVELLDNQNKVIHVYQSKVAYNVYQILGNKPIRPDIEMYLYKLEEEIRILKQEMIILKEKHLEETIRLNKIIIELEEKGEIV